MKLKKQKQVVTRDITVLECVILYYDTQNDCLVQKEVTLFDNDVEKVLPHLKFIKVVDKKEKTVRCRMPLADFYAVASKNKLDVDGNEIIEMED